MTYRGTFGVQFLPHHPGWDHVTAPTYVAMAEDAASGGIEAIWFSTRFLARDASTLMAMLAARADVSLGTLVANPWGRNPLELVSALGTIAELLPGQREVLYGIGSGESHSRWVDRPKALRCVRETIELSRRLLAGEEVALTDHPVVAEYFHLRGTASLAVALEQPRVSFWFALTGGPLGNKLAAEVADGVFLDVGTVNGLSAMTDGRLDDALGALDARRAEAGVERPLRRILNTCVSLSNDRDAAFARARRHAELAASRQVAKDGPPPDLSEEGLACTFLVGTPDEVAGQLVQLLDDAERLGCEHIVLGVPTGPDPAEAVTLAAHEVVFAVRKTMRKATS